MYGAILVSVGKLACRLIVCQVEVVDSILIIVKASAYLGIQSINLFICSIVVLYCLQCLLCSINVLRIRYIEFFIQFRLYIRGFGICTKAFKNFFFSVNIHYVSLLVNLCSQLVLGILKLRALLCNAVV